jgi:hypothetical protein
MGLVIDKGAFLVLLFRVYPVAYKEWPVFEYLDSNCGANLGVSEMKESLCRESQFTFFPFIEKV